MSFMFLSKVLSSKRQLYFERHLLFSRATDKLASAFFPSPLQRCCEAKAARGCLGAAGHHQTLHPGGFNIFECPKQNLCIKFLFSDLCCKVGLELAACISFGLPGARVQLAEGQHPGRTPAGCCCGQRRGYPMAWLVVVLPLQHEER